MCLSVICVSFGGKSLFKSFAYFKLDLKSKMLYFEGSLYMCIQLLGHIWDLQVFFSQAVGCLFGYLTVS